MPFGPAVEEARATDSYWIKTVGAPSPGDPRDGELHQVFGALPDHLDLEPWDDESGLPYARYVRSSGEPVRDDEGRTFWIYLFRGTAG